VCLHAAEGLTGLLHVQSELQVNKETYEREFLLEDAQWNGRIKSGKEYIFHFCLAGANVFKINRRKSIA
jgi:hypothetical protein